MGFTHHKAQERYYHELERERVVMSTPLRLRGIVGGIYINRYNFFPPTLKE
jgi:hypothetical protein